MKSEQPRQLKNFYRALDDDAFNELSEETKTSIEKAVLALTGDHHKVDYRATFPFFFKRYYIVLLMGRDLRKIRRKESPFKLIFLTLLLLMFLSLACVSVVFVLYIIKSALGIDIFQHSFGVWDWFQGLIGSH